MTTKTGRQIKIQKYDDIFGAEDLNEETIHMVPLEQLHDFEITIVDDEGRERIYKHPFKVVNDGRMAELAEDIKQNGVLQPGLAMPRNEGGYTIVFGHRRKFASQLAGLLEMPVYIKELSAKSAIDIMYGSNIQRPDILPSEKAFSYKMKYEACKCQGKRTDLDSTSCQVGRKLLMETEEDSERQILRYISLTKLINPLLDYVDIGKLPFTTACELSGLTITEQQNLLEVMEQNKVIPSREEAEKLKKYSKNKECSRAVIEIVLERTRASGSKIILKPDKVNKYFPKEFSKEDKEKVIFKLLEQWKTERESN